MKYLNDLKKSVKFNKLHLSIILYDLLFYVITTVSFLVGGAILKRQSDSIDTSILNEYIIQRTPEEVSALNTSIAWFLVTFLVVFLLIAIAVIGSWSLSRGMMYAKMLGKKFDKKYFWKFFWLNVVLGIPLFIAVIVFSRLVQISWVIYLFYAFVAIVLFFVALIYIEYTKKHEVFSSIGRGLSSANVKLLIPALTIAGVFIIISYIIGQLGQVYSIKYVSLFVLILVSAWARPYFVEQV